MFYTVHQSQLNNSPGIHFLLQFLQEFQLLAAYKVCLLCKFNWNYIFYKKCVTFIGIPGLLPGPSGVHNNSQENNYGKCTNTLGLLTKIATCFENKIYSSYSY